MRKKPGIIRVRTLDPQSVEKLERKLQALEKIIAANQPGDFPKRVSIANFARWENSEQGAIPLPRTWIYHPDCLSLQRRLVNQLDQLKQLRAQRKRKVNAGSDLRQQLKKAEERAQDYVNQYSETRNQLVRARSEIDRLNEKLSRCLSQASKVTPLRLVTNRKRRKARSRPNQKPKKR